MAKLLAIECGIPLAELEEYFVAGLLHDLGKVPFGDEYTEVLAQVATASEPLLLIERRVMDIDHQEVGQMIAVKWKLNPTLTDAICHHHAPEHALPENQTLVATVALADFYVCLFDIGYAGNRFPDEAQLAPLLAMCSLEWDAVVALSAAVDAEIKKAEIFLQT